MRNILFVSATMAAALLAGTCFAAAGSNGFGRGHLGFHAAPRACALGYTIDETGRCYTNSFGFGALSYPLGYSVGPFANFAPLYGRPYRPVAVQGFSEYVSGY